MENKYFWNVKCVGCAATLRLSVKEEDLGRIVEAICPHCDSHTQTTIGVCLQEEPVAIPPEVERELVRFSEIIKNNPEINAILQLVRQFGFRLICILGVLQKAGGLTSPTETSSKVGEDGSIAKGTFTLLLKRTRKDSASFSRSNYRLLSSYSLVPIQGD